MATATLQIETQFTPTNGTQPTVVTPAEFTTLSGSASTQVAQLTVLLAAAGTSFTIPVPANWTAVDQIHIQNTDLTGYCALTLNATSGAPVFVLAPLGGTFATAFGTTAPAGGVVANPATWTLKSCSSAGVTASGTATYVYIYMAGH